MRLIRTIRLEFELRLRRCSNLLNFLAAGFHLQLNMLAAQDARLRQLHAGLREWNRFRNRMTIGKHQMKHALVVRLAAVLLGVDAKSKIRAIADDRGARSSRGGNDSGVVTADYVHQVAVIVEQTRHLVRGVADLCVRRGHPSRRARSAST